jgi:uncharacterized protein YdhG (YjbR/CyaY superfamily)
VTKTKNGKATRLQKTVDEYLAAVPEPARSSLTKIRDVIRSVAPPDTTEGISYGMPTFKYKGKLASFAAFSDHCSLFPGAGPTIEFKDELKNFQTSKGTIRFAPNQPLPTRLLEKVLKSRIRENEQKENQRKNGR